MSETVISILVWLHVIGVAIWLGGQIITAACVIPALRAVGDRTIWLNALEGFTKRFGRVGIAAMVVIVITGVKRGLLRIAAIEKVVRQPEMLQRRRFPIAGPNRR